MTDEEMAADGSRTLAIRARITALLGEYAESKRGKRTKPLPAKVRTIRRRVKKLHRRARRARKVA